MTWKPGKGFLESDYRILHQTEMPQSDVAMHYHDFRKIVVLLAGSIDFAVEDRRYPMEAGDVLLVEAGAMHRPILEGISVYERMIICLSKEFLEARPGLDEMFIRAAKNLSSKLFVPPADRKRLISMTLALSDDACSHSRFPLLLQQSRLNEFLIELNDVAAASEGQKVQRKDCSESVRAAVRCVNEHLAEDLSTEKIALGIGLTGSCLMHLFKREMGMTLRSYVADKRLFRAVSLLNEGCTAAEACTLSGFSSYSSFYRAYMERYGTSPKNVGELPPLTGQDPEE